MAHNPFSFILRNLKGLTVSLTVIPLLDVVRFNNGPEHPTFLHLRTFL